MESEKLAFYPGCTLEGTSSGFTDSLYQIFKALDIPVKELEEWSCCGATSAHAMDHEFHLGLNLRNLCLAEAQGFKEILAPCAACYHRLASSNNEFQSDASILKSINTLTGLNYQGSIKVKNILDFLANQLKPALIQNQVISPLNDLKVACYYGCLNTRIPGMESFDRAEYPNTMDQVVQLLAAKTVDWSYKTECCGASLGVTLEQVSTKLVTNILNDAIACEADCIAVACPMCHVNLDTKQDQILKKQKIPKSIPIYYITQLMGLAFGIDERQLGIKQNFVSPIQI